MLSEKDFYAYMKNHVREYLPSSFEEASISLQEILKNNDMKMTGMLIRRNGENVFPVIYLDSLYSSYRLHGDSLDACVRKAANQRIANEETFTAEIAVVEHYNTIKDKLVIRLCDPEINQERLKGLVYTIHGDFAATYYVKIMENGKGGASIAVTDKMLLMWGISKEQLHGDALAADRSRNPGLYKVEELIQSITFENMKPENYFGKNENEFPSLEFQLFTLTNEDCSYGASLVLQPDLMEKIGTILGRNYYVLPSSIHETMIFPDDGHAQLAMLSEMVKNINETSVEIQERLSDKVQYYDCGKKVLENAERREERMMTKIAKKHRSRCGRKM